MSVCSYNSGTAKCVSMYPRKASEGDCQMAAAVNDFRRQFFFFLFLQTRAVSHSLGDAYHNHFSFVSSFKSLKKFKKKKENKKTKKCRKMKFEFSK